MVKAQWACPCWNSRLSYWTVVPCFKLNALFEVFHPVFSQSLSLLWQHPGQLWKPQWLGSADAASTSDNCSSLALAGRGVCVWCVWVGCWSSRVLGVTAPTALPWFHLGFVSCRNEAEVWCGRGPTGCGESAGRGQPFPQELEHVARIQPLWFWRRTIYIQISLQLEPRLFPVAAAVFYLIRWKIKSLSVQDPKILISNVVLNPESYCPGRKLLLSFSIQRVCFVLNLTSSNWLGGFVTARVFAVDLQDMLISMGKKKKKTVRGYLGQHLNLGLKYMLKG